jgi:putative peptidoglycan lipid II flippase
VVGIAVGTVLLPEMARRLAVKDDAGAAHAQARCIELSTLLGLPFVAAALVVPDLTMRALFARGAFTTADAADAAATLRAYGFGLLAFVVVRAFIAPFHARGDTRTPMIAALTAVALNVALKFALMGPLAQVGLAFATAVGGWINVSLLILFAWRRGFPLGDAALGGHLARLALVLVVVALALWGTQALAALAVPARMPGREEVMLALVVLGGGAAYAASVWLLLGRRFLAGVMGRHMPAVVS